MTLVREPLQVVEIRQPLCSRTFGTSPCLATGEKCFNTDFSCKYREALDLTDSLTIQLVSRDAHRPTATGFDPSTALPLLQSVRTAPTVLNVASGDRNISPLGIRAVATVVINDTSYNDVGLDPYVDDRSYDVEAQGTLWGRWMARNPYFVGYSLTVYDGYRGDALVDMIKREYFMERIDRDRKSVQITAKDILRKITDNDTKLPVPSPGVLSDDIDDSVTTIAIAGALEADYPAPGWVRIGDEIISYASVTTDLSDNVEISGGARAQLNTAANSHTQDNAVQWVLAYENEPFQNILYDMTVTRSGISSSFVDKTAWDDEKETWRDIFNFTGYITTPTPTGQLLAELLTQAQANIWYDERIQEILLRANRPNALPETITQGGEIVADSFVSEHVSKDRVTQVWAYYDLRNPTLDPYAAASYRNSSVTIDVAAEESYDESAPREMFCRWVSSSVIANSLAESHLRRFRDVRKHVKFQMTAKDIADFWTGDVAVVDHWMEQDVFGANSKGNFLITSAQTVENGALYAYTAEDNDTAGVLWEWVADDNTDPDSVTGVWVDENGEDGSGNVLPFAWI